MQRRERHAEGRAGWPRRTRLFPHTDLQLMPVKAALSQQGLSAAVRLAAQRKARHVCSWSPASRSFPSSWHFWLPTPWFPAAALLQQDKYSCSHGSRGGD